ncbi:MAG: hypothetical protein UH850_08495, partial [Paludibacteraceae bacterium]|nr:hypothetical protein [Paludibacteraceae bacterium]
VSPSATEKSSILHHQPSIINLSSSDSCPLRRRQSVTVVRGRCVTSGDGKILHPPPSIINHQPSIINHPSSIINLSILFPTVVII